MGYNTLYSNSFQGANQNPLSDGGNWTLTYSPYYPLEILDEVCTVPVGEYGYEYYSGGENLTSDQWASFQIASLAETSVAVVMYARYSVAAYTGYFLNLYFYEDPNFYAGELYNPNSESIWFNLFTINTGDVFRLSCIGSTISVTQNGTVLTSVTDTTSDLNGTIMLGLQNGFSEPPSPAIINFVCGSYTSTYSIGGNCGVSGVTVAYSGTASGSVTSGAGGAYTISGLANGSYTITPTKTGYAFSPTSHSETVSGSNITGVNFTATSDAWSQPDDRDYSIFPNDATNVQGTETYTVPAHPSHPAPTDSRKNKPVDSRKSAPQNSRTNPPFES